jgi:hypothetical protein
MATAGVLESGGHRRAGQLRGPRRVWRLASSSSTSGASRSSKASSAAGKYSGALSANVRRQFRAVCKAPRSTYSHRRAACWQS